MQKGNYKKALRGCYDVLNNTKGINYIICVCDATSADDMTATGGHAWDRVLVDGKLSQPDFATMVGGMIESYLRENEYSYKDKIKFLRDFQAEMLDHITSEGGDDEITK